MAIDITVAALAEAMRVGDEPEETAEVTRLRDYSILAISTHLGDAYEDTPAIAVNMATSLLTVFFYDKPTVSTGVGLANAMKFSGATRVLLPYRIIGAGLVSGAAIAAAQAAVGTEGNPVTGVDIVGDQLVITFADGSTESDTLPAGGGGTVDQIARDNAATAQDTANTANTAADGAQTEIDAHELTTHNTDATARAAAVTAQAKGDEVSQELVNHESTPHGGGGMAGVDQTARNRAQDAQDDIDNHELDTHNTDTVARAAATTNATDLADHEANHPSGGDGLAADTITDLPGGDIHSNVLVPGVNSGTLEKYTVGSIVGLAGSSAGLGPRLNPSPSLGTAGKVSAVNAAGDAYNLITVDGFLMPDANGQYRDPTAADVGRVIGDNHNVRIGSRVLDSVAIPTIGRTQYAAANFLGLGSSNGAFDAVAVPGDFIFNTFIYAWYINRGPGDWTGRGARPSGFIGWWHSRADAESHVRGVGDIYYVQGERELWTVNAYDAGAAVYSYHWVTPQEIIALLDRNELPDGVNTGDAIVWNGNGWELGRLPTRADTFPHVSRIPVATESSAEVLYLDHEYYEGGIRTDVTLRIGSDGNDAGYIDPRLGATLGSINAQTPVIRIEVLIASDGTTIERWNTIEFFEEGGANEFDRVFLNNGEYTLGIPFAQSGLWKRRFLTEPAGFQIDTDIAFNLRRTLDGSAFHTDGAGVRYNPGLWQKYIVRDGLFAYDHLSGPRIQHSDGTGEPLQQPTRNGEFYVDNQGQTWVGLVDRHILTTESAVATHILEFDQYVRAPQTLADLLNGVGVGGFTWIPSIGERELIQALSGTPGDIGEHRNWFDTWTLVAAQHAGGDALNADAIANRDAVWLGGFHSPEQAADEASHIISQADYDGGRRIFYGHAGGGTQGIYQFTAYTQGTVTVRVDGHWIGPYATIADIETIANNILDDAVDPVANEAAAMALDLTGVLYLFAGGIRYNGTTYTSGGGGGAGYTSLATGALASNQFLLNAAGATAIANVLIDGAGDYIAIVGKLEDFARHQNFLWIPLGLEDYGENVNHEFYGSYVNNSSGVVSGMRMSVRRNSNAQAVVYVSIIGTGTIDAGTALTLFGES